jgi:hypothetical protein
MATTTLRAFLDTRRVTDGTWNITGVGLGPNGWNGKYRVSDDDYDDFLTLHAARVFGLDGDATTLRPTTLMERHLKDPAAAPILIDLDFRYPMTFTERQFKSDAVRRFITEYCKVLYELSEYDMPLRAFIMMKPAPRRDPVHDMIKDGIHIVIPDVTVPYGLQKAARERILQRGIISACFANFTNPEKDVLDFAVIERNNWFLYGGTKPDNDIYAIVECLCITRDGDVMLEEVTDSPAELTRRMSLRAGRDSITEGFTWKEAPTQAASVVTTVTDPKPRHRAAAAGAGAAEPQATDADSVISHVYGSETANDNRLQPLLLKIPAERWNTYSDWLMIGMALFNEGCSVELWDRMSQTADTTGKYTPGECARKWASFRRDADRKVTARTLLSWIPDIVEELIDDVYACRRFVTLMGDEIHREDDDVYVFNTSTGMWSKSHTDLLAAVHRHKDSLLFKTKGDDGRPRTLNYGGNTRNINNMLEHLKALLPNERFISNNIDATLEYLLFADGMFHIPSQTFTEGFDKTKVFTANIPRPFPRERNPELEAEVNQRLFVAPFTNTEVGRYLKMRLARAIAGCYMDKKFLCALGEADSSKGTITNALRNAFGGYITEWDANCLKYNNRSGTDEAKRLSWLVSIMNARLAISNEIRMDDVPIEANLLKTLAGGGDMITLRQNYKDEQKIIIRTSFLFMGNDMPEITPKGTAIETRVRMIRFAKRFVEHPVRPNEMLADPTIKSKLATTDWMDAVFWIIADAYGTVMEEPMEVKEETKEWIPPEATKFREVLEEAFVIDPSDKSPENYVPARDIITYIKAAGLNLSDTKIGRELSMLGLEKCVKNINGKATKSWKGIKE